LGLIWVGTMTKRKQNLIDKDYSQLPFSVYYEGPLGYTTLEFLHEGFKLKKPFDIKGLRIDQGYAYGVSFLCEKNTGAELKCCLLGNHPSIQPRWLALVDEENLIINSGDLNAVSIEEDGINLAAERQDEVDLEDLEPMGTGVDLYHLHNEDIEFIVLDVFGDQVKVDPEGYVFNDDDEIDFSVKLSCIENLLNDQTIPIPEYGTFESHQEDMISCIWKESFPKLKIPKIVNYAF